MYTYIHVYILCIGSLSRRSSSSRTITGSFIFEKPTMEQVARSTLRWMGASGRPTMVRASTTASAPLWWSGGWTEWTWMHRVSQLRSGTRHRTLLAVAHGYAHQFEQIARRWFQAQGSASSTIWGRFAGRHAHERRRNTPVSGYEPEEVLVGFRRWQGFQLTMWVNEELRYTCNSGCVFFLQWQIAIFGVKSKTIEGK